MISQETKVNMIIGKLKRRTKRNDIYKGNIIEEEDKRNKVLWCLRWKIQEHVLIISFSYVPLVFVMVPFNFFWTKTINLILCT